MLIVRRRVYPRQGICVCRYFCSQSADSCGGASLFCRRRYRHDARCRGGSQAIGVQGHQAVSQILRKIAHSSFCRHVDASFIRPRAEEITSFLLTYLRIDIKEEPLYLILETLNAVMRTDLAKLNPRSAEAIGEAVFDVWLRNATGSSASAQLDP